MVRLTRWKLHRGDVIEDRFVIDTPMTRTMLSQIYVAHDRSSGQNAVIKLFHITDPSLDKETMRQRFERELKIYAKLEPHPRLVGYVAHGEHEGAPYAALDFVEGAPLSRVLGLGPVSPVEAKRLMMHCLEGLDYTHGRKIVHRDFKPANIMVTGSAPQRDAVLLDFGLAGLQKRLMLKRFRLTIDGDVPGTLEYMAPEQIDGKIEKATDIYAWALVYVETLTAQPAIPLGETALNILKRHLEGELQVPAALDAHPLGQLLRRCLDVDPRNRPTAPKLLELLDACDVTRLRLV